MTSYPVGHFEWRHIRSYGNPPELKIATKNPRAKHIYGKSQILNIGVEFHTDRPSWKWRENLDFNIYRVFSKKNGGKI